MSNEKKSLTAADLALYLGCDVMTPQGIGRLYRVEDCPVCGVTFDGRVENYFVDFDLEQVKPILRPLSDMTEDETNEVQYQVDQIGIGYFPIDHAKLTLFLLSSHFDLFGWINAGLAIDKTKIETI